VADGAHIHSQAPDQRRAPSITFTAVGVCIAIGLTYIYWAFFACISVLLGGIYGSFRTKSKRVMAVALIYIVVIGASATLNVSASLAHWIRVGANTSLNYKQASETDVFPLRIRQMLTPIVDHPLPLLRYVRDEIASENFPFDSNESVSASLGTVGSLGLLILVIVAVFQPNGGILADTRLKAMAALVAGLILIGTAGGFGSLFNVFVIHEFRCYNRISPFVSLLCFAAVANVVRQLSVGRSSVLQGCFGAVLIVAASFDQLPATVLKREAERQAVSRRDEKFIKQLENHTRAGSMIFQLPHTSFPVDNLHERMGAYDNARAYLHSRSLRWSWGTIEGRHHNWAKKTAELPTAAFLERIAFADFEGVLLDRWGYPDQLKEGELVAQLGSARMFDSGDRWVFFDLSQFRSSLTSPLSPGERQRKERLALEPAGIADYEIGARIDFGKNGDADRFKDSGWSDTEQHLTWTDGKSAILNFSGLPSRERLFLKMTLAGHVKSPQLPVQPTTLLANRRKIADWKVGQKTVYTATIPSDAVSNTGTLVLELRTPKAASPKSLRTGFDRRRLGVCVFDLIIDKNP
jgi:hypothetical protein